MNELTKEWCDNFVEQNKHFYCKETEINNRKIYLYNYILADYEAFQNEPLSRELRGLVFVETPNGYERFLSVPKFFNINEIPETQYNSLKHKLVKSVRDKLDGSLITPIKIDGDIVMKSKGSLNSPQSEMAQEIVDNNPELKFFILDCYDNNFYPFFELIGFENQHVVEYNIEKQLDLIQVRTQEGNFVDLDKFDYPYKSKELFHTIDELLELQKTEKNIEGWVVYFEDDQIVKIKTEDFFIKHKIKEQSDSFKDVLKAILNEDLDDILSVVPETKKEKLLNYNKVVTDYIIETIQEIQEIVNTTKDLTKKEFAIKYKNHPYFSVLMSVKKGKDIKETLIEYILKRNSKEQKAKEFIQGLTNG